MMNNKSNKCLTNLRLVFAIAWKDILEGWKNKVILTSVITALFLVIFYTYLPDLTMGDEPPMMVIYDPYQYVKFEDTKSFIGFNHRVERQENIFLYVLRDLETPVIGIILEQDPRQLQSGSSMVLQGYYPYWMKSNQVEKIKTAVEMTLGEVWDVSIEINVDNNIIYPLMDNYAYGKTFVATAGLMLQLAMMGLSMAPQLIVEEKDSRTLQAIVVSPATMGHFIMGKTIAVLFYSILTTAIGLFFVGPLVIHWGLVLAALFIGMLTIITPGILLGVLLESKQQIQIWVWVMFIPIILPIFFSIVRVLPDNIMKFIDWWPTVALARLLRAGFTLNPPISAYRTEMIYLLSLSLVLFGITFSVIHKKTIKGA